jgi:hypothetical protein
MSESRLRRSGSGGVRRQSPLPSPPASPKAERKSELQSPTTSPPPVHKETGGTTPMPAQDHVVTARPSGSGQSGPATLDASSLPQSELSRKPEFTGQRPALPGLLKKLGPPEEPKTQGTPGSQPLAVPTPPPTVDLNTAAPSSHALQGYVQRFRELSQVDVSRLQPNTSEFNSHLNALYGLRRQALAHVDQNLTRDSQIIEKQGYRGTVKNDVRLGPDAQIGIELLEETERKMAGMLKQVWDGKHDLPLAGVNAEGQRLWHALQGDRPFLHVGREPSGQTMSSPQAGPILQSAVSSLGQLLATDSGRQLLGGLERYGSVARNTVGPPLPKVGHGAAAVAPDGSLYNGPATSANHKGDTAFKDVPGTVPPQRLPFGTDVHMGIDAGAPPFGVSWGDMKKDSVTLSPPEVVLQHELDHMLRINQGKRDRASANLAMQHIESRMGEELKTHADGGKAVRLALRSAWENDDEFQAITQGEGPLRHELGMNQRVFHSNPKIVH